MQVLALRHVAIIVSAAACLIAGCSYAGSSVPKDAAKSFGTLPRPLTTWFPAIPARSHTTGWLSPALRRHTSGHDPLIYVSEENENAVVIYPEPKPTGTPLGMITNGVSDPWGLCTDRSGDVYSVNQTGTVTEYPPGSNSPSTTYSQGLGRPLYCIVDRYGDLFVGNGEGGANGGEIVEYEAGKSGVYRVIQTPGNEVDDMDFDAQGNLYAAYRDGRGEYGTSIERFAPGSGQGVILGMVLNQPQGLVVDNDGNIIVVTEWMPGRNHLAVFRPGKTRPQLRFRQPKNSYPIQIAITKHNRSLFATTFNNGEIYEVRYPLTKESRWHFERYDQYGFQQGIALSNG